MENIEKIKLRQGGFVLIDNIDFELVKKWKWWIDKDGYARRWTPQVDWKRTNILMHREILGLGKQDKVYVDHINRNKLDNRRSNLRIATKSQNGMNIDNNKNNKYGFRGISYALNEKRIKKWQVKLGFNNKNIYIGRFLTKEEAIKARKEAELKYYGQFSRFYQN